MSNDSPPLFVSRAGLKLEHALEAFKLDVHGLRCADFGCNVGGFTDCLLQRGAASVIAVDTGYGTLAWKLRSDARVIVMERTNALHAELPAAFAGGVDLVTIDLAWTKQRLAIPAALRWLRVDGRIVTLVKPHYEVEGEEKQLLRDGALSREDAQRVFDRVLSELPGWGLEPEQWTISPITGGKSAKRGRSEGGNVEYLVLGRAKRA